MSTTGQTLFLMSRNKYEPWRAGVKIYKFNYFPFSWPTKFLSRLRKNSTFVPLLVPMLFWLFAVGVPCVACVYCLTKTRRCDILWNGSVPQSLDGITFESVLLRRLNVLFSSGLPLKLPFMAPPRALIMAFRVFLFRIASIEKLDVSYRYTNGLLSPPCATEY